MVKQIVIAGSLCFLLSGCMSFAVGSVLGASSGYYVSKKASDDDTLARAVKQEFRLNTQLRPLGLDTAAKNGVITIYGFVPNEQTLAYAIEIAKKVEGVKAVQSQVLIAPLQ